MNHIFQCTGYKEKILSKAKQSTPLQVLANCLFFLRQLRAKCPTDHSYGFLILFKKIFLKYLHYKLSLSWVCIMACWNAWCFQRADFNFIFLYACIMGGRVFQWKNNIWIESINQSINHVLIKTTIKREAKHRIDLLWTSYEGLICVQIGRETAQRRWRKPPKHSSPLQCPALKQSVSNRTAATVQGEVGCPGSDSKLC